MSQGAVYFSIALLIVTVVVVLNSVPLDFRQTGLQQAVIAATVVASGWIITFLFRELSESISRSRKSRELQRTFLAEIFDYTQTLHVDDPAAWKRKVEADVMAGGNTLTDGFFPYFAKISEPVIFDRLAQDVTLLPTSVIDSVIQFYSTLSDLRLFVEEVNSPEFRSLDKRRRIVGYKDLTDLLTTTEKIALDACEDISRSLKGNPEWLVDSQGNAPK